MCVCGAENLKFQILDKLCAIKPGYNEVSAKEDTKMAVRTQSIIPISEDSASRRLHSTQSASQVTSEKWVIVDWESPGPGSPAFENLAKEGKKEFCYTCCFGEIVSGVVNVFTAGTI